MVSFYRFFGDDFFQIYRLRCLQIKSCDLLISGLAAMTYDQSRLRLRNAFATAGPSQIENVLRGLNNQIPRKASPLRVPPQDASQFLLRKDGQKLLRVIRCLSIIWHFRGKLGTVGISRR